MSPSFRAVAVIPCLNEVRAIAPLVAGLKALGWPVWVVDDGSDDGTGTAAEQAGAVVLRHTQPRGKGASLREAWAAACDQGFDWALCLDGDGQHLPEESVRFRDAVADGTARLVVGNRMGQAAAMPPIRRWTNCWMSRRLSRLTGLDLPDSQCGYRLVPLGPVSRMELETRHFEIESELLVAAARMGLGVAFVPITTRYAAERSKISPLRDAWRWWRWWRGVRRPAHAGQA